MSKEQLKAIFILWIFVITIELLWLFAVTWGTTALAASIITLIAVTMIFGAFGIYMIIKNVN